MKSPGLHTPEHPPLCTAEPAQARKTRCAGKTTPGLSPSSRCGLPNSHHAPHSHRDWPQPACADRSRDGFRRSRTGGRASMVFDRARSSSTPRNSSWSSALRSRAFASRALAPAGRKSDDRNRCIDGRRATQFQQLNSTVGGDRLAESAPDARRLEDRRKSRKSHWCNAWATDRPVRDSAAQPRRRWLLTLWQREPLARLRTTGSPGGNRVLPQLWLANSSCSALVSLLAVRG